MITSHKSKWIICVLLPLLLASCLLVQSFNPVHAEYNMLEFAVQNEITKNINALRTQYPEGRCWTNQDPSPGYRWFFPGSLWNMGGCAAFAAIIQDNAIGSYKDIPPTWQKINDVCRSGGIHECAVPYAWENLWPGDIIRFDGHTVIVVTKNDDYITIAEGNYAGTIHWDRKITKTVIEETAKYVLTRYTKTELLMPYLDLPDKQHWTWTPVTWALIHKIMEPAAPMYVMADTACTRADMITYLWRAFGSPEPAGGNRPFIDITPDMPCYKAVYWAFDAGVTVGTSSTLFSPGQSCTRAQALTMIWRAVGSPNVTNRYTVFEDVNDDNYYFKTVNWAIKNNITSGTTATTFSPKKICSKAEAVAFLYRSVQSGEIDK